MTSPRPHQAGSKQPVANDDADARPRLILVCGLGGTGKTTLADLLAQHLNIPCLHKDDIKTAMHDAGVTTTRSFQIFGSLVEKVVSNRVDLIIEATMHVPADWDLLRRWQDQYDLDLVCVICSVDRDERERRIRTRKRHPAHADADERQLAELDLAVDYARLPGLHIDVTTEGEPLASARAVLAQMPAAAVPTRFRAHATADDPSSL